MIRPAVPAHVQTGQSTVELAMILPVFLVIILGTVEMARLWWTQQGLINAAREGLRTATQYAGDCHSVYTLSKARETVQNNLTLAGLNKSEIVAQVDFFPEFTGGINGQVGVVRVKITYHYNSLLPFLPGLISQTTVNEQGEKVLVTEATSACEP